MSRLEKMRGQIRSVLGDMTDTVLKIRLRLPPKIRKIEDVWGGLDKLESLFRKLSKLMHEEDRISQANGKMRSDEDDPTEP